MIEFFTEPKGDVYNQLIDYALKITDAFMFVCCNYYHSKQYSNKAADIRKQLAPLAIKRRMDPNWPDGEKCWLTTVAHEEMIWITNETKEDITFLKAVGLMDSAGYHPEFNEPFVEPGLIKKGHK